MTKTDLLENWDIVCDKNLNLELANIHITKLGNPNYLLDKYHIFTSGGTSGQECLHGILKAWRSL